MDKLRENIEKIHLYKIFGIELDLIFTVLISYWVSFLYKLNIYKTLFIVLLTSIIVHRIFRINTTINKSIFGIV